MLHSVAFVFLPAIWIVDAANGPGTNFLDLPAAIAAAADGDTIIVRAGTYSALTISGMGLQIRGAGSATTVIAAPPGAPVASHEISATPAGIGNVLSGLYIQGGLHVVNHGRVTLLDCTLTGADAAPSGGSALSVTQAEALALRCRFEGGDGLPTGTPTPGITPLQGGTAVAVYFSRFAANDCDLIGGDSVQPAAASTLRGGVGLIATVSSRARLDHSRVTGGTGGVPPLANGTGGFGIDVSNDTHVQIDGLVSDIVAGGFSTFFSATGREAAMRLVNQSFLPPATLRVHGSPTVLGPVLGTVAFGEPDLPSLIVSATTLPSGETDASQPVAVTLDGLLPLQPYVLVLGLNPAYLPVASPLVGDLLIDLSSVGTFTGVLDAAGQFQFAFVPVLAFGGLVPSPVHAQAAVFEANGQIRISNADTRYYSL